MPDASVLPTEEAARPAPAAKPSGPGWMWLRVLLPALASGLLLWLCYFPVAWGWLGWVALVPLLSLVRSRARGWLIFLGAWLAGLVFFWASISWMRVADDRMYYTWAALSTYCSFYFPLAVFIIRRLDRRTPLPLVVTVPVTWTALELLRAHLMTGFPWYFLGHTQHAFLPLIQIADLGGGYAVTFVVAAVNACLFELLASRPAYCSLQGLESKPCAGRKYLVFQSAAVVVLLAATLAYGLVRMGQAEFTAGPRVALLQSNLDQRIRMEASSPNEAERDRSKRRLIDGYEEMQREAARSGPALIVWPETSHPEGWGDCTLEAGEIVAQRRKLTGGAEAGRKHYLDRENAVVFATARLAGTPVLIGLNSELVLGPKKYLRYNSAVMIQDGAYVGRYDKKHRVPFGEYVPLVDSFPWMKKFAPYDYDYSVAIGEHFTRFPLAGSHFGVLICYEDTDPTLARQYVNADADGPACDFLVNISNDGWFGGSAEHDEHLAICRFRAVECRRPVVRSVNMGISAVIDGDGRVLEPHLVGNAGDTHLWQVGPDAPGLPVSDWHQYKKVSGVLTAAVPLDNRTSLYALWGDWLPWSCWVVAGMGLVGSFFAEGIIKIGRKPERQGCRR